MEKLLGIAAIGLSLGCAGCMQTVAATATYMTTPDKPMLAAVELRDFTPTEKAILAKFMAAGLKDPGSAQFRWVPFPKGFKDGEITYCAQVNARNGYGGYNGYEPFIGSVSMKNGQIVSAGIGAISDSRPLYRNIVPDMCRKEGLNPFAVSG